MQPVKHFTSRTASALLVKQIAKVRKLSFCSESFELMYDMRKIEFWGQIRTGRIETETVLCIKISKLRNYCWTSNALELEASYIFWNAIDTKLSLILNGHTRLNIEDKLWWWLDHTPISGCFLKIIMQCKFPFFCFANFPSSECSNFVLSCVLMFMYSG